LTSGLYSTMLSGLRGSAAGGGAMVVCV
jgi:hypothetical protein